MLNRKLKMSALALFIAGSVFAGNRDRSGQAGAGELLLNPWARSSGLFGLNAANVTGIEAMKCNIAGLSKTKKTEIGLAHTRYLAGTGMSISNLGIAQNLGRYWCAWCEYHEFWFWRYSYHHRKFTRRWNR
ncbi:MAG: hypothetical protein IPN26_15240 [Bacteroidetes bacterium]|nr:hypothetical protein [Bacteroidota bacterium]